MADAVTTTTLEAGNNRLIMQFTNISDGTGENAVTKITLSNYSNATGKTATNLIIDKIEATCSGMKVKIDTDQSSNPVTIVLGSDYNHYNYLCEHGQGLLMGTSGSYTVIRFSTIGAASNATYNVVISARIC